MTKKWVYGCLFVMILCFIFGNSILTKEMSGAISRFVASILGGSSVGEEEHYLVRKLAHFTEYAALGVVSCLFFDSMLNGAYGKYTTVALVGVIAPLIDETIQIFSERGPALGDVWLDISGYAFGSLVIVAALMIIRRHAKKVNETG